LSILCLLAAVPVAITIKSAILTVIGQNANLSTGFLPVSTKMREQRTRSRRKPAQDADEERPRFLFLANAACLDFVNTEVIAAGQRVDLLADFADLVDWLRAADLIDDGEAQAARERWEGAAGRRALERARQLRAELRAMAERAAAGRPVAGGALEAINEVLRRPVRATEVRRAPGGFARADRWMFTAADDLLAPVAESARDLLVGGGLALVRKCRNPECILYFHDSTKNRARAWCSMSACGNREKVASHYRRQRAARPDE
jgi:predicted RNA-binding Zn ribbon-like protein